jgi:hypothetical protein
MDIPERIYQMESLEKWSSFSSLLGESLLAHAPLTDVNCMGGAITALPARRRCKESTNLSVPKTLIFGIPNYRRNALGDKF